MLIGYVQGDAADGWLRAPDLETDAYADELGGAEPVILNAAAIEGLPPVNIHTFKYPAGRHRLQVKGTGSFVVLGVVPQTAELKRRDARRG